MNQTLEFNADLGDKWQFMILYNIHWNKTAFADYLLEAQECRVVSWNRDLGALAPFVVWQALSLQNISQGFGQHSVIQLKVVSH